MLATHLRNYYELLESQNKSQKTIKAYGFVLDAFIEGVPEYDLEATVRFYYSYTTLLAPSSANLAHSALKGFCDYLVRQSVMDLNPFTIIPKEDLPPSQPQIIPLDEFEAIQNKIDKLAIKQKLVFSLIYHFCLRVGDLIALDLESFDLTIDNAYARVGLQVQRLIPIKKESAIYSQLTEYLNMRNDQSGGPLFVTDHGRVTYSTVRNWWRAEVTNEYTLDNLRQSRIAHLLQNALGTDSIQLLSGHRSANTTQRHIIDREAHQAQVLKQLSERLE